MTGDLGLDLVRTTGRAATPIVATVVRELVPADLALLSTEKGVKPTTLKRLRDNHHAIARLIAEGKKNTEITLITGYSASRISILKGDPAFQELVAHYKGIVEEIRDESFYDFNKKLAALGSDAVDELADRLNESPELVPVDELIDIVKMTADRTGHGPQTKSTNVNVNVDLAARISAGRQRVAQLSAASSSPVGSAPVLEGEVLETSPLPPPIKEAKDG